MKTTSGESGLTGETQSQRKAWSLRRWLLLIALVLVAHVTLIFTFGARKPVIPRPVTNVPELEFTAGSSEWLSLNDPTLFALPRREGFAWRAWLKPQHLYIHMPVWPGKSPPYLLELSNDTAMAAFGAVFTQFMQTNRLVSFLFPLKPPAQLTIPVVPLEPTLVKTSTLQIEGVLAKRPMPTSMKLPSWPSDHLIAPSRVQVLVNSEGRVVSAVLLPSKNSGESHDAHADQHALDLAQTARFAPASGFTVGQLIFDWYIVAPAATNASPDL